ncbi:MAG: DNA phosphorothioation-dependent restriction protein DptG [Ruminococcus sp.]|nr:DNA phosphorothioation-dependent restriction protein DptG [Ruminococcus sp.]
MEYNIDQAVFNKTFLDKNGTFSHKTNLKYNLFPFTGSTSDKVLDSFDNILGAFLRNIYSLAQSDKICRNDIINKVCEKVSFGEGMSDKLAFQDIIRNIYFNGEESLKCTSLNTYKYSASTKNDNKISEYITSTICDKEKIKAALVSKETATRNMLDSLVEKCLPELQAKSRGTKYLSLFPKIKEYFTKDFIFLIEDNSSDFYDMIQLISYYYFFYTSQTVLMLNEFCKSNDKIHPIYFCMGWEKTSGSRDSVAKGWRQLDAKRFTMFSHAVLLEMLNQTGLERKFSYKDIYDIYNSSSNDEQRLIFNTIENIKLLYRTQYAAPDGFNYAADNYVNDDIESLIKGFFDDIMLQFKNTSRSRANESYQQSFYEFCRNNFLQNRKKNGLVLVLSEEQLVLMTKIIIGNEKQMRLNTLFEEFRSRGVYMDKATRECVVEFSTPVPKPTAAQNAGIAK